MIAAAAAVLLAVLAGTGQAPFAQGMLLNHPAIRYQEVPPDDAVARLNQRLERGETRLEFEPGRGYLRSVLAALGVSEASQVLVFSKTSFQHRLIGPSNPRALYFDDTVSVGWVRGGEVLEVLAQDPRQGAMFYTLEQKPAEAPRFRRDLACVPCHTGDVTMNVPGMFLSSVFPDAKGEMIFAPVFSSNHTIPFDLRWGGWYVTGTHALPRHLGNATVKSGAWNEDMVSEATVRRASLDGLFDPAGYLSLQSDVVALMVLEHQAHLLNVITRLGWESRIGWTDAAARDTRIADLVDYLLFVNEEPLPAPVTGTSAFARTFAAQGPRDSQGRSLRDLDLRTRLLRHPCSFLIYSEPFEALPDAEKRDVYARMWAVLSGAVEGPRYARLSRADREAVVGILRDTKPDLPSYFSTASIDDAPPEASSAP